MYFIGVILIAYFLGPHYWTVLFVLAAIGWYGLCQQD
jgi:ABC-type dipeptide/oligopeptide/nickel transport system permease subunit